MIINNNNSNSNITDNINNNQYDYNAKCTYYRNDSDHVIER